MRERHISDEEMKEMLTVPAVQFLLPPLDTSVPKDYLAAKHWWMGADQQEGAAA